MNQLHKELQGIVMLNGYILCWRPKKEEARSEGGIILPVTETDARENVYQIVAMADDVEGFSIGDEILVDHFAGSRQKIGMEMYDIAKVEDVILKFPKKAEYIKYVNDDVYTSTDNLAWNKSL